MTAGTYRWRVLKDRSPFGFPTAADVLATLEAPTRDEARAIARTAFASVPHVVVDARCWPIDEERAARPVGVVSRADRQDSTSRRDGVGRARHAGAVAFPPTEDRLRDH